MSSMMIAQFAAHSRANRAASSSAAAAASPAPFSCRVRAGVLPPVPAAAEDFLRIRVDHFARLRRIGDRLAALIKSAHVVEAVGLARIAEREIANEPVEIVGA
jgi:hypothetical protein